MVEPATSPALRLHLPRALPIARAEACCTVPTVRSHQSDRLPWHLDNVSARRSKACPARPWVFPISKLDLSPPGCCITRRYMAGAHAHLRTPPSALIGLPRVPVRAAGLLIHPVYSVSASPFRSHCAPDRAYLLVAVQIATAASMRACEAAHWCEPPDSLGSRLAQCPLHASTRAQSIDPHMAAMTMSIAPFSCPKKATCAAIVRHDPPCHASRSTVYALRCRGGGRHSRSSRRSTFPIERQMGTWPARWPPRSLH